MHLLQLAEKQEGGAAQEVTVEERHEVVGGAEEAEVAGVEEAVEAVEVVKAEGQMRNGVGRAIGANAVEVRRSLLLFNVMHFVIISNKFRLYHYYSILYT